MLEPRLDAFASLARRLREVVERAIPPARQRQFREQALDGEPFARHRAGDEDGAAQLLKEAIARGGEGEPAGRIALVGAGPGARDLLPLRAVQRLQEAVVIFFDRLVGPGALELARRDAERVCVGKAMGAHAWPQERISRLIMAEARKGRRVVRLKSGDPSIFGRAEEELAAAYAAGIPVEVVPGVTAASAAAASLGRPLTARGEADALVIATATCAPGEPEPDWASLAWSGTTFAFYMAVERAGEVEVRLQAAGLPTGCEVEIVASTVPERRVAATLGALAATMAHEGVTAPAMLLVRHPKTVRARAAQVAA